MIRAFIFTLLLCVSFPFSACAEVATPSNATSQTGTGSGGSSGSGSTAAAEHSDEELYDMLLELFNSMGDPVDLEEEDPDSPVLGQVNAFSAPVFFSLARDENFVNVLRFDVSVDGTDYTLLFSPSYVDQLYVDANGSLWNMGTSQIQGLVLDGAFDPYNTTGTLVYLAPCLGNNFSINNNYGSPNWFREYYWSSSSGYDRLTYDDTYVQITVTKSYFPFFVGDTLMYLLIFLVGGGVIICWLNRFRRY